MCSRCAARRREEPKRVKLRLMTRVTRYQRGGCVLFVFVKSEGGPPYACVCVGVWVSGGCAGVRANAFNYESRPNPTRPLRVCGRTTTRRETNAFCFCTRLLSAAVDLWNLCAAGNDDRSELHETGSEL